MKLVMVMTAGIQVPKYNHNFNNRVIALICVRDVC